MPLPEGHRFNFSRIEKLVRHLHDGDGNVSPWFRFTGAELSSDTMVEFLNATLRALLHSDWVESTLGSSHLLKDITAEPGINSSPFTESAIGEMRQLITSYYGKTLTLNLRREMAWRVAGCLPRILARQKILYSFCPCNEHWTGLRIEDCHHADPSQKGSAMLALSLRVYDGPFAGMLFRQRMPYKFVLNKLARDIGIPRFASDVHRLDIVQFRMAGLLSVDREYPDRPSILEFAVPGGVKTKNVKLRKDREKHVAEGTWCHLRCTWPCHSCSMGYAVCDESVGARKGCKLATHSKPFVEKHCPACDRASDFDPSDVGNVCIACKSKEADERIRRAQYTA